MRTVRLGSSLLLALLGSLSYSQVHPPITDADVDRVVNDQMRAYVAKLVADKQVPGISVAIIHGDRVTYLSGGVRKVGSPETVDENTVFQLASMSKPISSSVVAALITKGLLTWDSKICDLDPGFQMYTPWVTSQLTVADCFSHRTGLPGECGNELEELGFDQKEILHRLRFVPPSYSFRAGYSYSNFGITEGAVAASKTTGKEFPQVAEEVLFRPLGMTSTSARYSDFIAQKNRAWLHIPVDGNWSPKLVRTPDAQAPAGGISSSAKDLVRWVQMELNGGKVSGKPLISKEALDESHNPVIWRGNGSYGYGWNVETTPDGRARIGHAGAFSVGVRTNLTLIPEDNLAIIVLTNEFPSGAPEAVTDVFLDNLFYGKPRRDWLEYYNAAFDGLIAGPQVLAKAYAEPPRPQQPALPNSSYTGEYRNAYVGSIIVTSENGQLSMEIGPNKKRFALKPFSGNTFLYFATPEWVNVPSIITFMIDPSGIASEAILDDFEASGNDHLTRVGKQPTGS
jgi:CubicO group peptidase (beta-lactamase class C family)